MSDVDGHKKGVALRILYPDKLLFEGRVEYLVVPTIDGETAIYPGHMPIVSVLNGKPIRVSNEGETKSWPILSGTIEVNRHNVQIFVRELEGEANTSGVEVE